MSPGWQRLHPMSLAVNLVPRMAVFVRAFWPILVLWWVGGVSAASMVDGTLLMLFFLVPMAQTAVHFFTLRYRMEEGRLEIQHGLLNRQARVIDPDRVQNVELTRNLFQRPFGLVEVRIETASGTDVEGMLSALRREDAEALVAEGIDHAGREVGVGPLVARGREVVRLPAGAGELDQRHADPAVELDQVRDLEGLDEHRRGSGILKTKIADDNCLSIERQSCIRTRRLHICRWCRCAMAA